MAFEIKGVAGLSAQLEVLGDAAVPVAKSAIYGAAAQTLQSVKKQLHETVSSEATGDLESSIGIASMDVKGNVVNTSVSFDGYDRKGTANILKARALNSGTSKQPATRFFEKGVSRARKVAKNAMETKFEREMKKRTDKAGD